MQIIPTLRYGNSKSGYKDVLFLVLKGWSQLHHQPVLKFPHFFPASLQAKTAEISKLVDEEAGSILETKTKLSLIKLIIIIDRVSKNSLTTLWSLL